MSRFFVSLRNFIVPPQNWQEGRILWMREKASRGVKRIFAARLKVFGDKKGNRCFISRRCGRNVRVMFYGNGNSVSIHLPNLCGGRIEIEIRGNGNVVDIESLQVKGLAQIKCVGEDCHVNISGLWIGENLLLLNGSKIDGTYAKGAVCTIGKGVTAESVSIYNLHSNCQLKIGDLCMISKDVVLMNSDSHPIYSLDSGRIVNRPKKSLSIGNNVWLGMRSSVLKGVSIANGCVVGYGAVVAKDIDVTNSAWAGSPAKIVGESVAWKRYDAEFV